MKGNYLGVEIKDKRGKGQVRMAGVINNKYECAYTHTLTQTKHIFTPTTATKHKHPQNKHELSISPVKLHMYLKEQNGY